MFELFYFIMGLFFWHALYDYAMVNRLQCITQSLKCFSLHSNSLDHVAGDSSKRNAIDTTLFLRISDIVAGIKHESIVWYAITKHAVKYNIATSCPQITGLLDIYDHAMIEMSYLQCEGINHKYI